MKNRFTVFKFETRSYLGFKIVGFRELDLYGAYLSRRGRGFTCFLDGEYLNVKVDIISSVRNSTMKKVMGSSPFTELGDGRTDSRERPDFLL